MLVQWPLLTEGVVVVIPPADFAGVLPPRTLLFLVHVCSMATTTVTTAMSYWISWGSCNAIKWGWHRRASNFAQVNQALLD